MLKNIQVKLPLFLLGFVGLFLISMGSSVYGQYKIMPLGNSITAGVDGSSVPGGYRDDLADMLTTEGVSFDFVGSLSDGSGFDADHEGHGGETAAYIYNNVAGWLTTYTPEFVLLHIGTNDIEAGTDLNTIAGSISGIIDRIYNHDHSAKIIVSSIIPRKDDKDSLTTELNKLILDVFYAKQNSGYLVYFAGHNNVFKATPNWQTVLMSNGDDTHPNDSGYNVMAQIYFNALMNAINASGSSVTDNFNRTELGPAWAANPEFQIINNELSNTAVDNGWNYLAIYTAQVNPTQASIKWGVGANAEGINQAGLALRLDRTASNAYGYLVLLLSDGRLNLWTIEDGLPYFEIQLLPGSAGAPASGDEFKVVMSSDAGGHYFRCYLNDNYAGEVIDPQKRQGNSSVRYAGVMLRGGYNNNVDDFNLYQEGDTTPPSAINDLSIGGQTTGSIILQWTAPGDDGNLGRASSYDIRYSKSLITGSNFEDATMASDIPTPGTPGSTQTFVVAGLKANTTYYFAVKTFDEVPNESDISNSVAGTTISARLTIDNFDRQLLGSNWVADPEFAIQNGELVNTSASADWDYMAVYTAKQNPVEAWIKWSETATATGIGRGGLALMLDSPAADADGYLAWIRPNDNAISLFTITSGTPATPIQSKTWSGTFPQANDTFKVAMSSNDDGHHFDYYVNGTFLTRITDPAKTKGNSENLYAGVMLHGVMSNNVEAFGIANQVGAPSRLEYVSGSPQTDIVGRQLPDSFVVRVTDDNSNPIAGVPIAFEITEGSGALDLGASPDNNIRIQAERAILTSPMQIFKDDPNASGGQYICTPGGDPRDGRAVYSIYIEEAGNYRVWGRVKSIHTNAKSFFFVMDNGQEYLWDTKYSTSWVWDLVSHRGSGNESYPQIDPVVFALDAGLHTFTILERWWGTCIDHIIFTKDPAFVPVGKEEYEEYVTDDAGISTALFTLGTEAGTNIITATAPNLSAPPIDFTAIGIPTAPESLLYVSGSGQEGVGGEQLEDPLVVAIADSFGNRISNLPVQFIATIGNGSFSAQQPLLTDEDGVASVFYTLGTDVVLNQVIATSDSVPDAEVTFAVSATSGVASKMEEEAGNNQISTVGQKLPQPFAVKILNESNEPVKNHPVEFEILEGNGTFWQETERRIEVRTNAEGVAEAWYVLDELLDTVKVQAAASGAGGFLINSPIIFSAHGIADHPTALKYVSGDDQQGAAGSPLQFPLVMKVEDQYGNPISGHEIVFTMKAGDGNFDGENSKTVFTESDGTTYVFYRLGPTAGETNRVEARAAYEGTALSGSPYEFEFVSGQVQSITYVDGSQQQGSAGYPLPKSFKVMIKDNFGNPVPEYDEVHFEITQGDATFNGAIDTTVQTNFDGIAEVTMTLGLTLGGDFKAEANAYKFGVPLAGNPITFTASAVGLKQLKYLSGNDQTGGAGSPLPESLRMKIIDQRGIGIAGQKVRFEVINGGGYINGQRQTELLTGEGGIVEAIYTLGITPGDSNNTAQASASYNGSSLEGSPYLFYASATVGAAHKMEPIANYLTGVVGNPLADPFQVKITDIAGNRIVGHPVEFKVLAGGGFFTANGGATRTVNTNEIGIASVLLTLGPAAGDTNNVIQATAKQGAQHLVGSPDTLKASAKSSAAANLHLENGSSQNGVAGTPLTNPFIVRVTDSGGNGVDEHPVTFIVKGGGGSLDGTGESTLAVNTNAQGYASTILTLGSKAGIPNVVQAVSTNGPDTLNGAPVTFSASSVAGPVSATQSTIVCEPAQIPADGETAAIITVTLKDSFSNPIKNKFVTLTATGQSNTLEQPQNQSNSDGIVQGRLKSTKAEIKTITARDVTDNLDLKTSSQVRFTALAAYRVDEFEGNAQIGNVNTALPEKLSVIVSDKFQNPIFDHEVRFVVTGGGGLIYEVQPVYSDSDGVASATLILGDTPGVANTVEARSTGLVNSPIAFMATGVQGTASRIERVSGDNQSAMSGTTLAKPLVTRVFDSDGRYLANYPVTYRVDLGNGHFSGNSSVTVETDAFGLASAFFTLDKEIGTNLVKAYADGLTNSPISFLAMGTAGKASVLKKVSGDMQTGLVGGYLPSPLRVQVTDYYGNGVAGQEVSFTVKSGNATINESQPELSDVNGFVSATIRLGTTAGKVLIEASSGSLVNSPIEFTIIADPLQAKSMQIVSGNLQNGTVGRELVYPLAVKVKDIHENPVSKIGISFAVIKGNGVLLDGQIVQSDSNGIARNRLQLGSAEGINTVYAIKTGLDNSPLTFNATGVSNKFPLFSPINDVVIDELQRVSFSVSATDDDGETVTYGVRNLPRGAEFDSVQTQQFNWTPDYQQSGRYTITFMAFDERGGFDAEDVAITVRNINRAPKIVAYLPSQSDVIAPKHGKLVFSVVVSDEDHDPLWYKWVRFYRSEQLLVSTSPSYEFISDEHAAGDYSIQATVGDGTDSTSITWNMTWTAVQLSAFAAKAIPYKGIELVWQTSMEFDNMGFNVYRSNSKEGEYRRINPEPISTNEDGEYQYKDLNVTSGKTYYYKLEDIDVSGHRTLHEAISVKMAQPTEFVLNQNYPNPFNPMTRLTYQLPVRADVRLVIYNIMGQTICELVNEQQPAGYYAVHWDGKDKNGMDAASGVYFYRIIAGNFTQTKRMVLLK
ncbi:Ig-like domain-containing protein [candidate division KSB1 bacterium]|nr:Ig-like domain-containing protein [candidate division KSB1 bacterium]